MNKMTRFILIVLVVLVAFSSVACKDVIKNPSPSDVLLSPAGDIQSDVTQWIKDTCKKDASGNCLTMGN